MHAGDAIVSAGWAEPSCVCVWGGGGTLCRLGGWYQCKSLPSMPATALGISPDPQGVGWGQADLPVLYQKHPEPTDPLVAAVQTAIKRCCTLTSTATVAADLFSMW